MGERSWSTVAAGTLVILANLFAVGSAILLVVVIYALSGLGGSEPSFDALTGRNWLGIAVMGGGFALGVFGVVLGVGILRRRRWAWRWALALHSIYALFALWVLINDLGRSQETIGAGAALATLLLIMGLLLAPPTRADLSAEGAF
jgi:hypothetical protein